MSEMAPVWNALAETWEGARDAVWSEPNYEVQRDRCVELIAETIGPHLAGRGKTVCEIGCGIGRLTLPLSLRFPNVIFIGQDISAIMLDWAMMRVEDSANVFFALSDSGDGVDDGPFDAVYSMLTFQHCEPKIVESYITSVAANLREGGVFFFQYVVGDVHSGLDHRHSGSEISDWLGAAGLRGVVEIHDAVHSDWRWVEAYK